MKIEELMRERRTIQAYRSEPVDESIVLRSLDLALWAPNHKLTCPWRFYMLGRKAREELGQLSVQLKEAKKGVMSDIERKAIASKFLEPSHLIAVGMKKAADIATQWEDYAAVAAGLQNAQLYLWSEGVGSKWSTGEVTRHAKTYELVGESSEVVQLVGLLWVGKYSKAPPAPARPKLDEVLQRIP